MKSFLSKKVPPHLKTFVVYLVISLVLLLFPAGKFSSIRLAALTPVNLLQAGFLGILHPVEKLVTGLAGGASPDEIAALKEQIARLKSQLAYESERRYAAESQLAQIGMLPAELQMKAIPAKITSFDASARRRSTILDKGTSSRVMPNAAVLWHGALIGRVSAVGPFTCEASLVGDRGCNIGVRCLRSRVKGVLIGAGAGVAVVKFVSSSADVIPGDNFVTSGADEVFPEGLLVGTCAESSSEAGDMFKWIVVKPAFDPALLEHVAILDVETMFPKVSQPENAKP